MDKQKRNLLITIVIILLVFVGGTVAYNLLKDRAPSVGMSVQFAPEAEQRLAAAQSSSGQKAEATLEASVTQSEREVLPIEEEQGSDEIAASVEDDDRLFMLDIPLFNLDDQELSFEAVRAGRPAIINYFASWCPPCLAELPHFEAAYQAHGEEIAFVFLNALDGQRETKDTLRRFIIEHAFSGPVYWDEGLFAYLFQTTSLPTTIFIAGDGEILGGQLGFVSEEQLAFVIEELLR